MSVKFTLQVWRHILKRDFFFFYRSCEILGNITSNRSTDATSRGRGNFVWEFFRNAMSALFGHTRENMQEGDEVERASIYGGT